MALLKDNAGLSEYTDAQVSEPALLALMAKVSYVVDPANPYPRQFTGHLRVTLHDGTVHEQRQGYFKGGVQHPLTDAELQHKFHANCAHGGLGRAQSEALLIEVGALLDQPVVRERALTW